MKPALVVLAAGASRRLGECKATVDLGGRSPLARLLSAGSLVQGAPPLVIAGKHAAQISAELPAACELAVNPNWEGGRAESIALAVERRAGLDLVLAPVDVPLVPAAVFGALLESWQDARAPAMGWLAPRLDPHRRHPEAGRHGHPVLIGRELAAHWRQREAGTPLRALRGLAQPLMEVLVEAPEILDDLDTPADLARLRARLASP